MIANRDLLEPLGFKLKDCGTYWQTNAAFRQGDNPAALQIYKDSGVWRDFVTSSGMLPFSVLLEKFGIKSSAIPVIVEEKEEYMKVEKLYDQKILSRLLPHYSFYNARGINDDTLKKYRGGLATQGKMYQRFTFPIFNEDGMIHGFDGRDMLDKENRPKWKKLGKKAEFVYPFFMLDEKGARILDDSKVCFKNVFLVESIGDSMAMTQNGFANHFVTFGTKPSSKLLCKILELNPDRIFISLNSDTDKEKDAGLEGSFKSALALASYFSKEKIFIARPIKKDFGEMSGADFGKFSKGLKNNGGWSDIVKLAREAERLKTVPKKITEKIT